MSKFITEPRIELVGHPKMVRHAISTFLFEHEMEWKALNDEFDEGDGIVNDSEWLIEEAGRGCYMSWAKCGEEAKGRDHQAHIKHLIEVGHGSVLEHVNFNFHIWGVSRSLTHELVRHRAGAAYCLAGDTEIYSGSQINGRFAGVRKKWTIEHLYNWSQDPRFKSRLKLMKVRCFDGERLVQTKIKNIMKSGKKKVFKIVLRDGTTIKCSLDHRFLSKNGWKSLKELSTGDQLATNGISLYKDKRWLEHKYHNDNFSQSQIAELAGVSKHTIRKWIRKYNLQKRLGSWSIGVEPWNKNKRYKAGWKHSQKTKLLFSKQKSGHRNPRWLGDKAKPNAGRLRAQKLFPDQPCEKCATTKQIHRHHIDRNPLNNIKSNIMFLCNSCHQTLHMQEDGSSFFLTIKYIEIVDIQPMGYEMTYDLEVDHPAHNFVANGFITHNSQLSQRYVDESQTDFVVPPALLELKEKDLFAYKEWERFCSHARDFYGQLTDRLSEMYEDIENKTERRKKARQAARSVLPNATETKIMVTFNGRSVRHFVEMRASPAADLEIRLLAVAMFKIMKREFPLIMHGIELIKLDDGTEAVTSEFRKV